MAIAWTENWGYWYSLIVSSLDYEFDDDVYQDLRGASETFDALVLLPALPVGVTGGDIVAFARDQLGFAVEPSQLEFLTSEAKRGVVNCSRQWGKSTLAAIKAVYRAFTRPGSLVLVVSPTKRQSGLLLGRVRALVASTEWGREVRKDPYHPMSLLFPNGSLIVGLPAREANIRGFTAVSMLIIDEAARVPDEVYKAVRPMLAVGDGDLWVLSTPLGRRGFFYEEFALGGERWARFEVPATACPGRISAAFLEDELASMGAAWVKQEYFCEFVDSGGLLFDRQLAEDAVTEDIVALVF